LQMAIREKVFNTVINVFKRHGAVTIETPVFELKETLTGKYGEDSKLIYDLEDQGGERCSLRYDLTVPFARYVAMNRSIKQMKRYHIARVYRRDNPAMTKGRFREFYQCDYDICGVYDLMIPDAECLKTMVEVLDEVKVGKFMVKLNHRKLLDGIFAICGVPEDQFRPICSAVDKLDKSPWEEVRKEMVEVKNLKPEVADKIEQFVKLCGPPRELLTKIRAEKRCDGNATAMQALEELDLLFKYLEVYGVQDRVTFDLSLARGLDYYTGVIYEAVLIGEQRVGSIAAGGRYDGLIGLFRGEEIPAVGFSVGVERIFTILEEEVKKDKGKVRASPTQVFVVAAEKELLIERMRLVTLLWNANIRAEFSYRAEPKIAPQLNQANAAGVPFAVIFGKAEMDRGVVQLKNMETAKQEEVPRAELVRVLLERLKQA